jgi:DNA-binding ferritin-like protein
MSMEEEFEKVAPRQRSNGRTDFVHLAEQVAQAMVQSAEEQVAKAQAMLETTRRDAEALLATVKSKDREIADMTNRIAALGEQVLEANRAFHAAATKETNQP